MHPTGQHVTNPLGERLSALAAVAEPVRRALYEYVVDRGVPVSRDEAAEGVGVAHHVAKFHLDKLEEEGLLSSEYRRPPGRGGPGAGRPAKLYRRSERQIDVSIPERRYDLAGRLLAEAVTDAKDNGIAIDNAVAGAATRLGAELGAETRGRAGRRRSAAAVSDATLHVLRNLGYEPRRESGTVTLHNCPFHALAEDYTELVCGMNLALLEALLEAAGADDLEARLEPGPGRCCVQLRAAPRESSAARRR